ncbi:sugar phosphate isomerase/epimerase [Saccharomonospora sp. NB11]|uniref:sugar phosphate isomerase/epimerase family protein n=1 Tax=Saccharomonospora sp. NB11 TaxID=1642298 RepID=UPI0018D168EC|nr:TIM barrel protein [Saccharomonospora sp. NB11]
MRSAAEAEHARLLPLDYLELKGDMLCVEADAFRALCTRLHAVGLPLRAMTSPLPRRLGCRVVGPDADPDKALRVFRDMCDRAGALGVRTVVLGSGQARSVPAGFPRTAALRQFGEFLRRAADICAQRDILLTVEPLTRSETNFLNSCAEARAALDELGLGDQLLAVDCFHVVSEDLPVEAELAAAAGRIGHAHTSAIPRGTPDFRPDVQQRFVASLFADGYAGGLSIEDDFTDFPNDAPAAVELFRRLLTTTA